MPVNSLYGSLSAPSYRQQNSYFQGEPEIRLWEEDAWNEETPLVGGQSSRIMMDVPSSPKSRSRQENFKNMLKSALEGMKSMSSTTKRREDVQQNWPNDVTVVISTDGNQTPVFHMKIDSVSVR
uniref:Uncharacterized protein n=1 Tax=Leptocylindrus danicus TaxID=163516 RepID=A0A7S2K365_9STRA|mmetsp:Transcript_16316/g.24049  ORF Transcript_16316/g.24049 Transcript_16316/m.24049 type:complete len:124 (+) Transcript_16316:117-488(+)|eukprot:CAMPEP_0116026226 /NCGR_PEP_ID=MMETSP0321-20121206/13676_1 /TAXON_ID=163516 /ORGANISM="Leptocylindrus danicus var. danicus, Strain B650" /LENGTH=123 /DNA_ID=CAMNT_0003498887 /DNA_START=112 /DNA_END=483 /DNA_ORIENTATION=+